MRHTENTVAIRPIDGSNPDEIALVACRMRDTLIEVLGEERGAAMYPPEWLEERVRWHLRPGDCVGQVLVAEVPGGPIVGHTIVRMDTDMTGAPIGLVSTTYVMPEWRRAGVAAALLDAGEAWLVGRGAPTLATNTSDTNTPLLRLYEKHGYRVTFRDAEKRMVQLTRSVSSP